jgi:tyrosyl-tRNA synthetase
VNNEKVLDPEAVISESELLHGQYLLLRRGKKNLATVEVLVP